MGVSHADVYATVGEEARGLLARLFRTSADHRWPLHVIGFFMIY